MLIDIQQNEATRVAAEVLGALVGLTVDLGLDNDGYPATNVHVLAVDGDGDLVVCETDDTGTPITNSTWAIPQMAITRVTAPVGGRA